MANTGNKIYAKLVKVINDGTDRPLDDNGDLCSISGLPQAIKDNNISDPNYIAPFQDLTACPIAGATAVNCELSAWSEWSTCSAGTQTRTRTVITPASNGGTACGPTSESRDCVESRPFNGFAVTYECNMGIQRYTEIYIMQVFSSAAGPYLTAGDMVYNDAALTSPVSIPGYLFKTDSDLIFNVYDVEAGLLIYQGRSEGSC